MKKLLLIAIAGLLAASFTGCSSVSHQGDRRVNVLGGLVSLEERKFAPKPAASFAMRRSDFSASRDVSGTQTSLLWGLVSYSDY